MTPRRFAPLGGLLVALALVPQIASAQEVTDVIHLLRRATYGVTIAAIADVQSMGIDGWLHRQTRPESIDDDAFETRRIALRSASMDPEELLVHYPPPNRLRASAASDSLTPARRRETMRDLGEAAPGRILADLGAERLLRAVYSERQLEAVMTEFWFNHFNVFWAKGPTRWLVRDYESTAIRPHVFGTFSDMLVATAQHPAMLVYLDNWRSAGNESAAARWAERRERTVGLNENYARELLELHTLGVDAGYTQADVVAVARAFTGWTLSRDRASPGFRFEPRMHDTGTKRVLDLELGSNRGMEDGLDVLHHLARHPATARHIATKLAAAFVSDSVPSGLVDDLTAVFLATDGDLRALTLALFSSPEFYADEHRGAKVKPPFTLIASGLRVTGSEIFRPSRRLFQLLRELDHVPYLESAPTGYPANSDAWVSAGATVQRVNFGLALASSAIDGVRWRASATPAGADDVSELARQLLPGVDTRRLEAIVRADVATVEGTSERAARIAGIVLASPEFQVQ